MHNKAFQKIISETESNYNQISDKFSSTRKYNWPEISRLIPKYLKPNLDILDIGCGNGRLLNTLKNYPINYLGIDLSKSLIKEAKKTYPAANFINQDFTQFTTDKQYDLVFAIAFLHHIPGKKLRDQVIKNIFQLTKNSGYLIMTNWNLFQKKYQKFFNSHTSFNKNLEPNDTLIPWKDSSGKIIANRYYHAFTTDEISDLLVKNNFKIIANNLTKYNILTIAQK